MRTQCLILTTSLIAPALAGVSTCRNGYGLIGYGITMYRPYCAQACRDVLSVAELQCTVIEHNEHGGMDGMNMDMGGMQMAHSTTEPSCFAQDDVSLKSLSFCIAQRCGNIASWKVERWWEFNVAGRTDPDTQPKPKWSYGTALAQIAEAPTETFVQGILNKTSLVDEEAWQSNINAKANFEDGEVVQEKYGLVILLSGVVIPVAFSLLRFVPFPGTLRSKFYAYIIEPPAFGSKHAVPSFFGMEIMPTRGQALFIGYFIVLNIVFSAVNIKNIQPNAWYPGPSGSWGNIIGTVTNRQGLLSFANLPLVFLYAGRNNVLLWVTNWSYSTFLLLHRWIAVIATLQAILHSLIWIKIKVHDKAYGTESVLAYWIYSFVLSMLSVTSFIPIRKKMYEIFLVGHISLAILALLGSYYHIIKRFQHQWGYETWINGVRKALITVIDNDYIRVDIPGVSGSGHAYLIFPTLTWRVWENHPFSVASTVVPVAQGRHEGRVSTADIEKSAIGTTVKSVDSSISISSRHNVKTGMTFLIKSCRGITKLLRYRTSLPVLVEAPYHAPHGELSHFSNMIVICGGVGITAVSPMLHGFAGRSKLYWGARTRTLIDEMAPVLSAVDKEISVEKRLNITDILNNELRGETSHTVVVVSGPAGMADDVRENVNRLIRENKISVKLIEESFTW